jgi:hypothetical protein
MAAPSKCTDFIFGVIVTILAHSYTSFFYVKRFWEMKYFRDKNQILILKIFRRRKCYNYIINRFVVVVLSNIICAKKSSIPIIFAICEGPYSNILSIVKPLICNNSIKSLEISRCSNLSSFHIAIVIGDEY